MLEPNNVAKLYRYESVTAVVKLFKCTACNKAIAKVPDGEVYGFHYRFCPNCGAKITYEGFEYLDKPSLKVIK